MRRTKIVCTIGPASEQPATLRALIQAGMNVARLNFSHGTEEQHRATLRRIRTLARKLDRTIAVIQDLQGPKIRVGRFGSGPVILNRGAPFTITTREVEGTAEMVSTSYSDLPNDVDPGDRVLLDDGLIELEVHATSDTDIECEVLHGGLLSDHKGINLPGIAISAPSVTKKDRRDLQFGIEEEVDFIAVSFVRTPDDVAEVQQLIAAAGREIPVIAKIEKGEAIAALDEIIAVADGVMVARGDLGVEMPLQEVPVLQKRIIAGANRASKVVITATQMLDSMMHQPRPTRAEVSDVANAIFDGTDAVMLSGETAIGKYPVDTVRCMASIAANADRYRSETEPRAKQLREVDLPARSTNAVGHAACTLAGALDVKSILTFTERGFSPRMVSKYRPTQPILAATPHERTRRRLALYWGVESIETPEVGEFESMLYSTVETEREKGRFEEGDIVVVTGSLPRAISGATNTITVHRVGAQPTGDNDAAA